MFSLWANDNNNNYKKTKEKTDKEDDVIKEHNDVTEEISRYEMYVYNVLNAAMYVYWIYYFVDRSRTIKNQRDAGNALHYRLEDSLIKGEYFDAFNRYYLMNRNICYELIYFQIFVIVTSLIMQIYKFQNIDRIQSVYTVACMVLWLGWYVTCLFLSLSLLVYVITYLSMRCSTARMYFWLPCIVLFAVTNSYVGSVFVMKNLEPVMAISRRKSMLISYLILYNWIPKVISFSDEMVQHYEKTKGVDYRALDMICYLFNTSRYFSSPMQNYDKYLIFVKNRVALSWSRVFDLAAKILDQVGIFVAMEILATYIYVNNFVNDVNYFGKLDLFHMYGLTYLCFHSFWLVQSFVFGNGHVMNALNGIDNERRPRSVLYVYNGPSLWRYFDRGTHLFLQKYIFKTISSHSDSMITGIVAKAACFAFIVVSHGYTYQVLLWAALGYLHLIIEYVFLTVFMEIRRVRQFQDKYISLRWRRRLACILYACISFPLLICGQLIFSGSLQSAILLFNKTFESATNVLQVIGFTYLTVQFAFPLTDKKKITQSKKIN